MVRAACSWAPAEHPPGRMKCVSGASFGNAPLDDYTLVNSGFSYEISRDIRLFGKVRNLADTSYEPVAGYRGEGINGIVGLTIRL